MKQAIKITKAALDDWGSNIILRGVIDPASLATLKVDSYQRGVQPKSYIRQIMKGFGNSGGVPDIELGMRGHSFTEADGDFFLHDATYVIDGLQRRTAALEVLKGGIQPKLGVMIHFDTTVEWETERFELLNRNRTKVSSSVLIRNLAQKNPAIKMLFELGMDSSFALHNRICWDQRMKRGQIIYGQVVLKTMARLHRRFGQGLASSRYAEVSAAMEKLMMKVGRTTLRDNVIRFWELLDEAFNLRGVEIASAAPHIKGGFLKVLARVLADHQDFWDDSRLVISSDLRRKIGQFAINDPSMSRLCGASGQALNELYYHFVEHINSGKRTRRLKKFEVVELLTDDDESPEGQAEAQEAPKQRPLPPERLEAQEAPKYRPLPPERLVRHVPGRVQ
jgi:hypothetical protein